MALLCSRILSRNLRNQLAVTSRFYADEKSLPEPFELATGIEKWQMEQKQSGIDDPFKMRVIKRHATTKANPIVVHSYYDCRIIGCVCEEDSSTVLWMWLFKGEPRRCQCGHWFKLEEYKPL